MTVTTPNFRGQFQDILVISELRGAYPNVPISPDVDYAALIAGDPDPVFLTLPIGKANVKSGNNRYYDDAWLTELMRQTLEKKPIGLMGHMTETERATAFKPEALHWVGAVRDGDLVWGKAYIIGEARERIRRYKASGKSIATSIDAIASGTWDESLGAYRMHASTLQLSQIDLAPTDRAGITDLARVPVLTTEMQDEPIEEIEEESTMDKLQMIGEMTAEDARLLPKLVREAVAADIPVPSEVEQVKALRSELSLDDKADVVAVVKEMAESVRKQRGDAVKARIKELVEDKEKGIKLASMQGLVMELVEARQPQTVEDADRIYGEVVASDRIKAALRETVQETMGPAARRPVAGQQGGSKYFNIPEDADEKK